MDRFKRMFAGAGGALGHPPPDSPTLDSSEQVYIPLSPSSKCSSTSGTGVSVEAVDHVFQTNMLDMLKQTGRPEMVVGWYHSHPGFGCWLSGVDINTQQSFEALNQRAVAVVVDPIQSVKGKLVIDAFRLINRQTMMLGQEPRQTRSNLGHLNKPSIQEMLNLAIKYNKAVQEEDELPPEKWAIANVGRQDAKKHLEEHVSNLMSSNIVQTLGTMLDTVVF
uniref:MPN domain-containing protein n=2 Tax=Gossypium raimondii TaxID=29730 RepID=A0A0D2NAJ3_GOSRA|nr:hypothetical protein B456_005G103800 [Gossypium raimondii]